MSKSIVLSALSDQKTEPALGSQSPSRGGLASTPHQLLITSYPEVVGNTNYMWLKGRTAQQSTETQRHHWWGARRDPWACPNQVAQTPWAWGPLDPSPWLHLQPCSSWGGESRADSTLRGVLPTATWIQIFVLKGWKRSPNSLYRLNYSWGVSLTLRPINV